jgi:gliding motility-associated-like protein
MYPRRNKNRNINNYRIRTIKKVITYLFFIISTLSIAQKNLLPDTTGFCVGDSAKLEIKDKFEKNSFIQWRTPYAIIENSKKITAFKQGGKYYVSVTSGKNIYRDSTYVKIVTKPKRFMRDTNVCKGKNIYLDAKNNGCKYFWNTGETTQKIKIETTGRYWVKISNSGCSVVDTVNVKFLAGLTTNFNNDMQFCLSDEYKILNIKPTPGTKIIWSTGSNLANITITKEGYYWVKTENKACGTQIDSVKVKFKACDCEMIIPNSFTPNEDNRNDYFYPILQCEYAYFVMIISDKWGNIIFTSNTTSAKWDGRFKGNLCAEENYIYRIESIEKGTDKKMVRTGNLSLFR